jgi:hypothetical protein
MSFRVSANWWLGQRTCLHHKAHCIFIEELGHSGYPILVFASCIWFNRKFWKQPPIMPPKYMEIRSAIDATVLLSIKDSMLLTDPNIIVSKSELQLPY